LNSLQNETASYGIDRKCLSSRELETLKLLCSHKTAKEIARFLNIAETTVIFHRQNIYKKTNCKRLTELIMFAIDQGIICTNRINHAPKTT
jgi:DNA-binding CsgD family transcriptional regulator